MEVGIWETMKCNYETFIQTIDEDAYHYPQMIDRLGGVRCEGTYF